MWHPFDMMQADLAMDTSLRAVAIPPRARLVYGERVIHAFPVKPQGGAWQPKVDRLPGITLTRQVAARGSWELDVEQRWPDSTDHALQAKITCGDDAWRSPLSWRLTQTLASKSGNYEVPPLSEAGRWRQGGVEREIASAVAKRTVQARADALTCAYSLLANFPAEAIAARDQAFDAGATLLLEGFVMTAGARFGVAAEAPRQCALAAGLRNYVLVHGSGFPLEYWVNEHGAVLYVCQGSCRALVLEKMEVLS